jgi:hypothetical protein
MCGGEEKYKKMNSMERDHLQDAGVDRRIESVGEE